MAHYSRPTLSLEMIAVRSSYAALLLLCAAAGFSAQLVFQRYELKKSDWRVISVTSHLDNTSLVKCCEACKKSDTCRSLSYHGNGSSAESACTLTDFNWMVFGDDAAPGWNTYARQYECPDVVASFKELGGLHLSMCPSQSASQSQTFQSMALTRSEARAACRQFGNLMKVNSTQKLAQIRKLAANGEYWVDGERGDNNKTWFFSDGTKIPMHDVWAASQPSTVGGACVTVNSNTNHQLANKPCGEKHGYICEIP